MVPATDTCEESSKTPSAAPGGSVKPNIKFHFLDYDELSEIQKNVFPVFLVGMTAMNIRGGLHTTRAYYRL